MALGHYNGWSGEQRLAALSRLKAALQAGELAPPTRCSICLADGSPDWRAENAIVFHDEDYSAPLRTYPVCKPCHSLVHLRFWRVEEWQALVGQHARGGAWFELLTLDPDSRYRPFAQTYPEGLPARFQP